MHLELQLKLAVLLINNDLLAFTRPAPVDSDPSDPCVLVAQTVRLLIPYSALLYLPDGTTFTYTNPEGHAYVRETVSVESISGDQAVLTAGPKVGTAVVTTGGAELWGTEFGIK